MKYIVFFITSVLFTMNLQAQTLEEANRLFTEKKYNEAAAMYYQIYQFNKAIDAYQMQIEALMKGKKPQTQAADSIKPFLIQMEKLARMVSRCENIRIIDSLVVDKNNFLNAYLLSEDVGTLKQTNTTVIYENPLKDHRYFSKEDPNGYFRLNSRLKIQNEWSEDKALNLPSDSTADDNFPFVMPDGLTIYYASTGNGSIGGYDIFVSRYNLNTDTYLAPTQLGMPFNSIYNDYLLVIDEVNDVGYFATDRFQPEDKVVVYTFIPNKEFTPVDSEDEQVLIDRARITSIRDTWQPNVNYQNTLAKIKASIEKEKHKVKKDFTFVINDNIVYYTLADFDSDAARNSFVQLNKLQERITTLENQLDSQRQEYAKGNNAQKQSLKSPILANEKRLEDIYNEYKKLLMNTRNTEIKHLRIKTN